MTDIANKRNSFPFFLLIGILGWFAAALFSMQFTRLNLDEPWYLTASHLVMQMQLPYRDFVFTQLPLLPYVYGAILEFTGINLATGRFVSVAFSTLAVTLAIALARRAAGNWAAILTIIGLLLTPSVLCYLVIVKTYALTAALTLFALYLMFHDHPQVSSAVPVISSLASGLAAFTRISFALLTVLVFFYWIGRGKWKESGLGLTGLALPIIGFAYQSNGNFFFDVIEFHQRTTIQPFTQIVAESPKTTLVIQTLLAFTPAVMLGLVLLVIGLRSRTARDRLLSWWMAKSRANFVWLSTSIILFGVHFVTWGNLWEYQVPVYLIIIPLLAAFAAVVMQSVKRQIGVFLLFAEVMVIASLPSWFFQTNSIFWDSVSTVSVAAKQAAALAQYGTVHDQVLGVYNHLALAAGKGIPLGNEMGLFSITTELSPEEARVRKFLVETDVTRLLSECSVPFAITNTNQMLFMKSSPSGQPLKSPVQELWRAWLQKNYRIIYNDDYTTIFQRRFDKCDDGRVE